MVTSKKTKFKRHTIVRVWASSFKGVECLEGVRTIGFFKDDHDRRPSSCTWFNKTKSGGRYPIFTEPPEV